MPTTPSPQREPDCAELAHHQDVPPVAHLDEKISQLLLDEPPVGGTTFWNPLLRLLRKLR
ncbi:MAG: hypothetical protein ABDI19_02550 [Armatimonadota bacterium]